MMCSEHESKSWLKAVFCQWVFKKVWKVGICPSSGPCILLRLIAVITLFTPEPPPARPRSPPTLPSSLRHPSISACPSSASSHVLHPSSAPLPLTYVCCTYAPLVLQCACISISIIFRIRQTHTKVTLPFGRMLKKALNPIEPDRTATTRC